MSFIPCFPHGGDHLIDHGRAVGCLGNAGGRTGRVSACDDGVINVLPVGNTGSGQHQNVGVDLLDAAAGSFHVFGAAGETRADQLTGLSHDDIGVQFGDHAGFHDGVRADDGGQADLLGALDRLFQDAQRQRLFHMIEHDALCACGDQRFRQNVGKAASRLQRVHVRGKDVDMLEDLAFEFDEAERFDSVASAKVRRLLGEYEIYPKNISVIEDKFGRIRVEILVDSGVTGIENPKLPTEIGKICSRYFQNGKITNFKNETMLSFSEKPNYRLSIGFAQHSAEGTLCGDTVKIINDNKGHSILIISDGMGKGSRAALDGAMGAGLISKLLNVGFGFDSALKVVNSALLVKSNDESLATLDIANIDLFTGKCEIYKAGAPASFIIKNSIVNKCELSSMPAGILRGIEFAKRTAVLSPSDSIVLFSDGITDLGDEWINKSLRLINGESPQKSADFLLSSALENSRGKKIDDMSVIIARMERN